MYRCDPGDDRDLRAYELCQRADLARMIHAHFEDRVARVRRAERKRERHAPMIVVRRSGGMR